MKYVALEELGALAEAGVTTVGENRAQDLQRKAAAYPAIASRGTSSASCRAARSAGPPARAADPLRRQRLRAGQLERHGPRAARVEILVEVNVAGEEGKSGIDPDELGAFLERSPDRAGGPDDDAAARRDPEDSRRWFAALRELADEHGLRELSMGTTQDYAVAVAGGRDDRPPRLRPVPHRHLAGISRSEAITFDADGLPRLMAPRARLLRPRRGRGYDDDRGARARGGAEDRYRERPNVRRLSASPPARRDRRHLRRGRRAPDARRRVLRPSPEARNGRVERRRPRAPRRSPRASTTRSRSPTGSRTPSR